MKIRIDATREEVETGCYLAKDCFHCPFSDCKVDSGRIKTERKNANKTAIFELADGGMSQCEITHVTGLGSNTVSYWFRQWKAERNVQQKGCEAI